MHISTLTARSFRNYDSLQIDFSPGVNIIVGANAQGKTNLWKASISWPPAAPTG